MSSPFYILRKADPWMFIAMLFLLLVGLLMVFSTTALPSQESLGDATAMVRKHFLNLVIGSGLFLLALAIQPESYQKVSNKLLIASIILLVLVAIPGIGQVAGGARRWLGFGPLRLQPGEFIKIFILIYFSTYIAKHKAIMRYFVPGIIVPFAILGVVSVLFLLQPDFGTTVVVAVVVLSELFTASRLIHFAGLGIAGVGMLGVAISMSAYRMKRMKAFLDPFADPAASGYQLIQSLIAVGSGGVWGTGIGGGKQKLHYLPEAHTDFIYAIIAEETGIVGSLIVLTLFIVIGYQGLKVCFHYSHDAYRCSMSVGITALICIPALLNMGVVLGLLPTKGMVLPFVSYGGSALMMYMFAMGMLLRLSAEDDGSV